MIQKSLNIALACLVLITTSGFSLSKHYCGDEVASVSVITEAESCCDMSSCCHTETEFYQLDDDFVLSAVQILPDNQTIQMFHLMPQEIFSVSLSDISLFANQDFESPPLLTVNKNTFLSVIQVYIL